MTRVTREIEGLALLVMNQLYAQQTGSKNSVLTMCWSRRAPGGWTEHEEIELLPNDKLIRSEDLQITKPAL